MMFRTPADTIQLAQGLINGEYRGIPFKALLLILAGIVYFVTPIDIIRNLMGLGLLDDAVILSWIISRMGRDLMITGLERKGKVIDIMPVSRLEWRKTNEKCQLVLFMLTVAFLASCLIPGYIPVYRVNAVNWEVSSS